MKKRILIGVILFICFFMLSARAAISQDLCAGDFDCDGDCDGSDAAMFKSDFGRTLLSNPCPCCTVDITKTGQTLSYATGDDGDFEIGFEPVPNPRFSDNGDGTVRDNLTGLIWLKNASCFYQKTWNEALSDCMGLADGDNFCLSGAFSLSDGSQAGDWRLPNVKELLSLIDYNNYVPILPSGHPFTHVPVAGFYWTSTTQPAEPDSAFYVDMGFGANMFQDKSLAFYVWPVRGGH